MDSNVCTVVVYSILTIPFSTYRGVVDNIRGAKE